MINSSLDQQVFSQEMGSYERISKMLKSCRYEDILEATAKKIGLETEAMESFQMGAYSKGLTSGAYRFVLQDLMRNVAQYDWVYSHLADETSRTVFANLIGYRVLPASSFLKAAYDAEHPQYFDKSIVSCNQNEVFVDCGGFTGETSEEFIRQFSAYKQIYIYEPSQENIPACQKRMARYPNVKIRPCGVGEQEAFLTMDGSGSSGTFMKKQLADSRSGTQIVSLDDDIKEPISFLKMDIEGSEISALLGAKRHIRDDFPKLAICTYHIISDMWEIPRLIDSIRPGYRFYFRHYNFPENWETVVYAVPPEPKKRPAPKRGQKTVAALSPIDGWTDSQLVKDCGLIPYLLHKNHSCISKMVGKQMETNYKNLAYVKGLQLEFLPDGSEQASLDYLAENAKKIDCLMLYGCYSSYFRSVDCYKYYNPQGKVCLALDANSHWMDRILWDTPNFRKFMDQCDVITAAGHTMQRHLNEKWPWEIEFIPNGFYNFSERPWKVDFSKKENIILTVGRLGTSQKATQVLLEAFAMIADAIPDWELRLVGSIEPSFESLLAGFWERYPALKSRIHFVGVLMNRDALYAEYLKAKVFALPSTFEGAANVVAEALYAGNAIAVTKIDEYQDATDNGRCGRASEIGDIPGFASILLQLCRIDDLDAMCRHAYEYAERVFNMEKAVARLYDLIFSEEAQQ